MGVKQKFSDLKELFIRKSQKIEVPEYTVFTVYSIFIGVIVGFAAVFFHNAIEFFNKVFFEQTASGLYFLGAAAVIALPAIGMFIQSLMNMAAPDIAPRRGVNEVIKAVAARGGYIPFRSTVFHFIAPVICIGSGGTVGPEGPAARLGGGIASKVGNMLKLSDSRRRMFTAAGAGAAIAAIFNTPLGGIFFALEIILLNDFHSATLSALILSSVTASTISRVFLGNTSIFIFERVASINYGNLYLYAILGIVTGIVSLLFIRYTDYTEKIFRRKLLKIIPQPVLMILVGLLVGVCGYFYKDIFGIGYIGINHILANTHPWDIVLILFAMKFLLVPLTLNSGGSGGYFAPALFMGAAFGFLFSLALKQFWGLDVNATTFILVSMGAFLGGINSIPIAAILIIFEMTKDYSYILPLMLAVVTSTMIVQIALKKSVHIKHLEEEGFRFLSLKESSILKSVFVEDVMKKEIHLIPEETPLQKLISELMDSKHGTLYIINKEGKLTGIITEMEVRPIITEYDHIREVLVAKDIARQEVPTVHSGENLDHVMKLFESYDVDEFPVVADDDENKVIGTVWRQDVIAAYNKQSLKYNIADGFAKELQSIDKTVSSKVAAGYSIIERKTNNDFVGKTLAQLRLRNKYGLEVLMIRREAPMFSDEKDEKLFIPGPDYVIKSDDILVLFGPEEKIQLTGKWNEH